MIKEYCQLYYSRAPVFEENFYNRKQHNRVLTPVGTPAVATDPVVHAVLCAPAVQLDSVVDECARAGIVALYATSVVQ